ncbi:amino acid adenylation domain-containing protein [Streptomyces sp. NPDC056347]|uniref:amino acid adenylation domain-containing protein n=1 Tax=Streptomyces sp. NPDC056347 TaxID=3345790 RepID=UPI0035DA7768
MNDPTLSGPHTGATARPATPPLLPQLFAAQAARTPDAPAVIGTRTHTYAELAARAEHFATHLHQAGLRPGDLTGVCLPRGFDLVAALLGIWLAGGTYVPLDPHHPAARIALVLDDTQAPLTLADRTTAAKLPATTRTLITDTLTDKAPAAPRPAPDGARPAYILHTSGSTGRPKGVVVPHAGIANRVRWLAHRHRLGPADRFLLKTTIGFDAAGLELFSPLISGAALVLAPDGAEHDPAALLKAVADHGVTVLQGVPSVYRRLVEEPGWAHATTLRLVFSAGEPLHADLCHRILQGAPHARIWNTYGPTEASVDITEHPWNPEQDTGAVPIGRPIGNMRVLVLDPAGHPVPVGVPGELHTGGPQLALGYLHRPDLTAERFVPDPHTPGHRLYRTGDQVRWRPDGTLEYLGRLDQQTKVNGVRIEPGEVEAALTAHPRLRNAAVAAVPDPRTTGQRLAAWIQPRTTPAPRPDELRAFLRRTLPDVLVPTLYTTVTTWPLTASGKTDRTALPDPADTTTPDTRIPPRTTTEHTVAEAWAHLTGTPAEQIGATSDFFQLGGSSLMLTRLCELLATRTGTRIPLRDLFTATTVETQARLLTRPDTGTDPAAETILPAPRTPRGLPLSPGQQSMWLLHQLRPDSSEWNAPVFLTLPAHYSDTTLETALNALADRHEILRTRYLPGPDGPVQVADAPRTRPPHLRTATATTPAELNTLVQEEFARPFDLENGPVWRALTVRHDTTLHVILSLHHIACDGWSSVVLERDLTALAQAAHTRTRASLPALPLQYADHAVHRRALLTDTFVARELDHWKTVLDGITPLDLPADRPRPPVRDADGAVHLFTVPADLTERVTELGRSCGATLQQTLLTAFAALVARLTGRWDIPVGIPVAGRGNPATADIVGFFLNTLVLRCTADAATTFHDAVHHVRDTARQAFAHQDLPFDTLVTHLDHHRDTARTPLYQVMFDLHEEGRTGTATSAKDLDAFKGAWQAARTDLTLVVQRQDDGSLLGMAEYATALFDPATIQRFTDCWTRLLESVTDNPWTPLGTADLLPAALRTEILTHGHGTQDPGTPAPPAPGDTVLTAVTDTARRHPQDTAVVCGQDTWTYDRLNRRAHHLAHRLHTLGARPETTVAVLTDRTPDLIAAILGTWHAGAAYVPLDPAAPDDRIAHILADSQARVLVTDTTHRARLARIHHGPLLTLDTDTDTGPGTGTWAGGPLPGPDPDRLAYLMYTSGSTGRPKGVAVEHRTLLATLRAFQAHLDFGQGPDDAYLALAQPTFDISWTELVMPLTAGGRVVLAQEHELRDHRAQIALIDRHHVSHLQAAPAHWQMLIDAGFDRRPLVGKTGGENCPPALARDLSRRLRRFINEYGLTETTIAATRWDTHDTATTTPIGRPYPHCTARVLDEHLNPVPYGVTGELCIGGDALARGYAGRPDLTAAAFLPDPHGQPGTRLYRSGDMARMLPDGTLEFAGRADGQAKIRGRRVETGEVQSVLAEHPAVTQAHITVHGTGPDAALIAYWVPAPHTPAPGDSELLDHCARTLPDYMVPALLVPLTTLPLTRHGKVDTRALPAPDLTAALADEPYTAPEGPVEEIITRIWTEVLHGPDAPPGRIGTRQGFFRSGGNSVRAAQVIARIQEEFDLELPLRAVFEHPTVTTLAKAVEDAVTAEIETLTETELALAHQEYQP